MNTVAFLALHSFRLLYSALAVTLLGWRAIYDGYVKRRPTRGYWEEVERTRERVWNLSKDPIPSFKHAFFTSVTTSLKIHYLVNDPTPDTPTKAKNLVFFIHGWPDTGLLWGRVAGYLPDADKAKTRLIAMDQPGFGASDSLPGYNADYLLEALLEFFLAMRERYLDDSGDHHVIICGHDWGAAIAFRLASEAPQLADRFFISNAAIKGHALENVVRRLRTTRKLFGSYLQQPTNFKLLGSAVNTLLPVLYQIKNSSYIFIYNLPQPIPGIWLNMGHFWFPRFATCLAAGGKPILSFVPAAPHTINSPAAAAHLASPMGPNVGNLHTKTANGQTYPRSVQERAQTWGGPWVENIKIYSHHFAFGRWSKSVRILAALHELDVAQASRRKSISNGSGGLIGKDLDGALKAPTTVIWGTEDPALNQLICVEGIEDWFTVKNSQVVVLEGIGHWTPSEGEGPAYWARLLSWSINGEQGQPDAGPGSKITVSK